METRGLKRPKARGSSEEAVLEALRSGYRDRDAAKVTRAYAEDAECTIVNRNNPPSKPLVLRGRAAVERMVADICSREMTNEIAAVVVGEARSLSRQCRYPRLQRVGIYMASVKDGAS